MKKSPNSSCRMQRGGTMGLTQKELEELLEIKAKFMN